MAAAVLIASSAADAIDQTRPITNGINDRICAPRRARAPRDHLRTLSITTSAAALREITPWVNASGLALHPGGTRAGDATQPGQGFDFLGYRFEAGRRFVREKSLRAFTDKVRARTIRGRGDSLERIIADLNPMLRGWWEYFKHARPRLFRRLDQTIRRRPRAVLRKQEKRPSMGRSEADHGRWTNAFFADHGLFTMLAAHESARCSR